ncbi:MAG: glycosyltransferase family 2 protein [Acidobacteriota bacterium]
MTILFLLFLLVLVQAYVGYPLSLMVLRLVLGDRSRHRLGDRTPSVSLLISAYNEEAVIRRKLENTLALDYPADRLDRIVISDGSTDRTEPIAREFGHRGIQLRAFKGRRGKVSCLNEVIPTLKSDVVVMSDANSIYSTDALKRLVRHFADPRIGCVCGRLTYVNPTRQIAGDGERLYWSYEGAVKKLESALGQLLGANGAMYAFRSERFEPVDPLMFCDDVIPVRITLAGYLTIYDPEACCTEEAVSEGAETRRRRRHASFGMRSMLRLTREALAAGRPLVAYQCVSHRILRWLGGPALLGMMTITPWLPPPWREAALAGQGTLYLAAGIGFIASRLRAGPSWLYLPYYFLVITVAGVAGLVALARRTDRPYWEPRL